MKKFLQYVEMSEIERLLERVPDHYEFCKQEMVTKQLKEKMLVIKKLEEVTNLELVNLFKDKLVFKMFNEAEWDITKISNSTNPEGVKAALVEIGKEHNIKLKHRGQTNG